MSATDVPVETQNFDYPAVITQPTYPASRLFIFTAQQRGQGLLRNQTTREGDAGLRAASERHEPRCFLL